MNTILNTLTSLERTVWSITVAISVIVALIDYPDREIPHIIQIISDIAPLVLFGIASGISIAVRVAIHTYRKLTGVMK